MPTTHARINAVLEPGLYQAVAHLAESDGVSLSQKVRDLLRDAIQVTEDSGWEALVTERRRKTPAAWVPHGEVKRRLGRGR